MEFRDSKVQFNLFDAMRYPPEEHSIFHLDIIDSLVEDVHENLLAEFPEIVGIRNEFTCSECDGANELCAVCAEIDACLHGGDFVHSNSVSSGSINSISVVLPSASSVFIYSNSATSDSAILHFVISNSINFDSIVAVSTYSSPVFAISDSVNSYSTVLHSAVPVSVFINSDSAVSNSVVSVFAYLSSSISAFLMV